MTMTTVPGARGGAVNEVPSAMTGELVSATLEDMAKRSRKDDPVPGLMDVADPDSVRAGVAGIDGSVDAAYLAGYYPDRRLVTVSPGNTSGTDGPTLRAFRCASRPDMSCLAWGWAIHRSID